MLYIYLPNIAWWYFMEYYLITLSTKLAHCIESSKYGITSAFNKCWLLEDFWIWDLGIVESWFVLCCIDHYCIVNLDWESIYLPTFPLCFFFFFFKHLIDSGNFTSIPLIFLSLKICLLPLQPPPKENKK